MSLASPSTGFNPEQLRQAAACNLDVFAGIVMPETAIYKFPPFYHSLWLFAIKSLLDLSPDNKLMKLLLILPRGHAKTTFTKLLVAYGIIHGLFNFVLVVCASDNNASNFVADVIAMLTHPNTRQLYGDWQAGLVEDNAIEKVSVFMGRKVIFKASSVLSGDIRGTQKNMQRPDFIVADDVQTKETADSIPKSKHVEDALIGTVFKAKSPHRCGILCMGNTYPKNSLVDKLASSGEFVTLRTGAVLANGEALWPELHSLTALRSEWKLDCALDKGYIWMAEVQNQPLEGEGLRPLFPDGTFPITLLPEDSEVLGSFVTVDPSGRKLTSDDTALAGHIVYEGGVIELARLSGEIRDPRRTILDAINMAESISARLIFVEAVAYQDSLAFWGEEVLKELRLHEVYQFVPLSIGNRAKLARIRSWVGELLAGKYIISDKEIKAQILYQGLTFKADETNNRDDLLDVAAAGTIVRNQHMEDVYLAHARRRQQEELMRPPQTVAGHSTQLRRLTYSRSVN